MDGRTIEVFEGNSRAARQALRLVTEGQVCRDRMCPLTTECVLLLQNVFSNHSSLKARFVEFRFLGFWSLGFMCIHIDISICKDRGSLCPASSDHRMCSLTTECVLLLWNGSEGRFVLRPLTTECVLLPQNVFSYYRMCSLTKGSATRQRVAPTDRNSFVACQQNRMLWGTGTCRRLLHTSASSIIHPFLYDT